MKQYKNKWVWTPPKIDKSLLPVLDLEKLKKYCLMDESAFQNIKVDGKTPQIFDTIDGPLLYWNRGAKVLGIAHLDSHGEKYKHFAQVGDRIYTASLDDRIGVYTLLHQLRTLDYDILLTTGEEIGLSTAAHFKTDKHYNWCFEFDRGGTDAVLYQYEDDSTFELIRKYGWWVSSGSFSDISYLEHLNCKCFNLAAAYYDYHARYAYLEIDQYRESIAKFHKLHRDQYKRRLKHKPKQVKKVKKWDVIDYTSRLHGYQHEGDWTAATALYTPVPNEESPEDDSQYGGACDLCGESTCRGEIPCDYCGVFVEECNTEIHLGGRLCHWCTDEEYMYNRVHKRRG